MNVHVFGDQWLILLVVFAAIIFVRCSDDEDICYKVPFPVQPEADLVHVSVGGYTNIDIFGREKEDGSGYADENFESTKYSLTWYFVQDKSIIDTSLFRTWDVSKYFKATIKPSFIGKNQEYARIKIVLDPNMMFALLDNYPELGEEIVYNLENSLSIAIGVEYDYSSDIHCERLSNDAEDLSEYAGDAPEDLISLIRLKVYVPIIRMSIARVGDITISNVFSSVNSDADETALDLEIDASTSGTYKVTRGETYTLTVKLDHAPSVGYEIEPMLASLVWDIDEMIEERAIADVQPRPGGILLGGGAVLEYGPKEHVTDVSSYFDVTEEELGSYARTWKGSETSFKSFNITVSELAPPGHHYLLPYVVSYNTMDTFTDIGVWSTIDARCVFRDYGFNVLHIQIPDWNDGLQTGSLAVLSVCMTIIVGGAISAAVILWMNKTGRLNDYGIEHFTIKQKLKARLTAHRQRKISIMKPDQRDKIRIMEEQEYTFFERLLVKLHLKKVVAAGNYHSLKKAGPPGSKL